MIRSIIKGAMMLSLMAGGISTAVALPNNEGTTEQSSSKKSNGTISGIVRDETGLGVPGVMLRLDKEHRYTLSRVDGSFVFLNVPAGNYTLSVQYVGFQDHTQTLTVTAGRDTRLSIQLKEAVYTTGEVVIVGTAKGQARALNIEKTNTNISNIVASDQIGRFPDANIGESLKRIAGITMQNDQGEARNIVVRGLASALNSVTINGGRIPSAEGGNRNVQMDLIPSDMIQVIEVNKTLLPDMEADAIGGSVNLVTKSAPRREMISATLGGGYNMIRNRGTYNVGFMYGNRFFGDKLGAVISGSYLNKDYGSDNIEGEWDRKGNSEYMKSFQIRKYDVKRARRSISLNLDYEFSPTSSIYFNSMFNWRDDWENRFATAYKKIKPTDDGAYVGNIARSIKMGLNDARHDARRLEVQQMMNFALGGTHLLSPKMEMDWGASFSRALERRPEERIVAFQQSKVSIKQSFETPQYPTITAVNEDYSKSELDELVEKNGNTWEDEWSMKANFRSPFSLIKAQKGRLRYGAKVRLKSKTVDNNYYEFEPINDFPALADIKSVTWDDPKFMNGKGYVPGLFPDQRYIGDLNLFDSKQFKATDLLEEYWAGNYKAQERIYAGYLRWDQNLSERLVLITGLRVEHTDIRYTGHTLDGDGKGADVTDGNSYTNLFPNLTLRYQPTSKWVLRTAFSTSIARPNYYALVPYVAINTSDNEISQGNPKLKSTYAYNFDFIATYYPGSIGQISFGAFYKRLNNFIYNYVDNSFDASKFANNITGVNNPIPLGDQDWTYRSFRNGGSVDLFGIELSYQRKLDFMPNDFLRRFSIYLNGTWTHSIAKGIRNEEGEERTGKPLPGTAPLIANASLAYEDKWFTARISYNHTNAYLDVLGSDDFNDVYYGAQSFLDFNASIKVLPSMQITLEANNLLDTPLFYYQGNKDRLYQLEYYKPTFNVGLKWNI